MLSALINRRFDMLASDFDGKFRLLTSQLNRQFDLLSAQLGRATTAIQEAAPEFAKLEVRTEAIRRDLNVVHTDLTKLRKRITAVRMDMLKHFED